MGALTSKPYAFTARPWELKQHLTYDIFDTVNSKIRLDYRGEEILRVLPIFDKNTGEEFILDRVRFFYDALSLQRVNKVFMRSSNTGKYSEISWQQFFYSFLKEYLSSISRTGNIGQIFCSKYLDLRGVRALQTFTKRNSLLVRHRKNFLESVDFVDNFFLDKNFLKSLDKYIGDFFLIGVSLRYALPLLNFKLRKAVNKGNLRVITCFFSSNDTYNTYSLGVSSSALLNLLSGKSSYFRYYFRDKRKTQVFIDPALGVAIQLKLKRFFENVFLCNSSVTTISLLSQGAVDKRNIWLEDAIPGDIATVVRFNSGFTTVLTTHPVSDIFKANVILPVFSLFEQGLQLFNIGGTFLNSFPLDFTTGRLAIRTEYNIFLSLSYFFELFFQKQEFLGKYFKGTFFLYNGLVPNFQPCVSVELRSYPLSLVNRSRMNLNRNIYSVDSLTNSSKFLLLASKRFKQQTCYA